MPTVEENERKFEEMGFAQIKILATNNGLPQGMLGDAIRWIARREEEERQRQVASQIEAKRTARSTLIAAWIAAGASLLAIVVACLAWLFPRT